VEHGTQTVSPDIGGEAGKAGALAADVAHISVYRVAGMTLRNARDAPIVDDSDTLTACN
jgi:hypothetical protein